MTSLSNSRFGYCLQKMDMCGYCKGQPCGWEELNAKKYNICPMYTNSPKKIFEKIENMEELKLIGLEIMNRKGKILEMLLDTCYHNTNRESALEHLTKTFAEDYCVRILFGDDEEDMI